MKEILQIPYNVCFCLSEDHVLMLLRSNHPNQGLWNGVGGKLQEGESPIYSVIREVYEETGISLAPDQVLSKGIVTWNKQQFGEEHVRGGMYLYLTTPLPDTHRFQERETREGRLMWQPTHIATDTSRTDVVSNVPHFLKHALTNKGQHHYRLTYVGKKLHRISIEPLEEL